MISNFRVVWWGQPEIQQGTVCRVFKAGITSSPTNPDPSKVAILRIRTPAIQVQAPPFGGCYTLGLV